MSSAAFNASPTPSSTRIRWRPAISWALYDWANSAFATAVISGFVPVLNKISWNAGVPQTVSPFRLTAAISTASLLCAVFAPILGAMADRGGAKKRFRLVVDLATEAIHTTVAGGPSDRRFSRWYASDLENWVAGRYKTLSPQSP